jgi:hypothetical protein
MSTLSSRNKLDKLILHSINRIDTNLDASINSALLEHAFEKLWINDWEYDFLKNTLMKRRLTVKMKFKRQSINSSILFHFNRENPTL